MVQEMENLYGAEDGGGAWVMVLHLVACGGGEDGPTMELQLVACGGDGCGAWN